MITYMFDGDDLTAKTDVGARRQANKIIKEKKEDNPKYKAPTHINFYRSNDGCNGWIDL